jgi:hypothetical protein
MKRNRDFRGSLPAKRCIACKDGHETLTGLSNRSRSAALDGMTQVHDSEKFNILRPGRGDIAENG